MKKYFVLFGCAGVALVLFLGVSFFANAQITTSTSSGTTVSGTAGITFPIPELGNCGSKDECRAYCNDPVSADACIAFGQAHGLMNHTEASSSKKFAETLINGGGPGGCATPGACKVYCSDLSHMSECVAFAKKMGIKNDEVSQAEKIQAYVAAGGAMPGGCTSKDTCEAYCSDFSHASECLAFAQKIGLAANGGSPNASSTPPGQFQKFLILVKNGQTPGGCTSKDTCEAYCKDQLHFTECLTFAQNAGFVSSSTAQSLGDSHGKGPGGCDSQSACSAYCNDPTRREECYSFAEGHGSISKDRIDESKKGYSQLLVGLSQMPPDVAACVTSTLGDQLGQIQSGAVVPGPEIGAEIKNCFDKFGKKENPGASLSHVPPQILSCLKAKLGDGFVIPTSTVGISPDIAQSFRMCAEAMNMQSGENGTSTPNGHPQFDLGRFLNSAPPGVAACVKDKLGSQTITASSTGTPPPEIYGIVKDCMQEFRPQNGSGTKPFPGGTEAMPFQSGSGGGTRPEFPPTAGTSTGTFNLGHLPEQVAQCIQSNLSADEIAMLKSGQQPNSGLIAKINTCYGQNFKSPSGGGYPTHPQFPSGTTSIPPPSEFHPLLQTLQPPPPSDGEDAPPINPQTPSSCSGGEVWDKGLSLCVNPADKCAEYGGTWTNGMCQMTSPSQPPAGGTSGGTTHTQPPPPPPPTSLLEGASVFGSILKIFAPLLGM